MWYGPHEYIAIMLAEPHYRKLLVRFFRSIHAILPDIADNMQRIMLHDSLDMDLYDLLPDQVKSILIPMPMPKSSI